MIGLTTFLNRHDFDMLGMSIELFSTEFGPKMSSHLKTGGIRPTVMALSTNNMVSYIHVQYINIIYLSAHFERFWTITVLNIAKTCSCKT